jgi:hypothetical protein
MRFNGNRQLPVLRYGQFALISESGLRIYLMTSNPASLLALAEAIQALIDADKFPTRYEITEV